RGGGGAGGLSCVPDLAPNRLIGKHEESQGWWEPLIMGTAGVQTQEVITGMVGTPHNRHSRCTDPGTQRRDGGNPS
ncbi:unnamed protein product, partial [Staurois parvus]